MIRPVRPEDVSELVATEVAVLRDGRGQIRGVADAAFAGSMKARIERYLTGDRSGENGGMWVAETHGEVIGEALLDRHAPSMLRHVASLALQVHPAYQGRGLGKGLLEAVVAYATEIGIRRLELFVRADNERAIGLYRAAGFALESVRPAFVCLPDGSFVDDLVMVRHLAPPDAEMACGIVVRGDEFLVLQHPLAGWQLPKGTIDPSETPAEAAVREVGEETGLVGLGVVRPLGSWTQYTPESVLHRWHGFVLQAPDGTPDAWDHAATGSPEEEGLTFRLCFQPIGPGIQSWFHPGFHEALIRLVGSRR